MDNMSLHESSNHGLLSDLLRDKELENRSRFISSETIFGNLNDIPDKSFDNYDEEKYEDALLPSGTIMPPVELLGIPLEAEMLSQYSKEEDINYSGFLAPPMLSLYPESHHSYRFSSDQPLKFLDLQ